MMFFFLSLVEDGCTDDLLGHAVRVAVGGGATVFHVSKAVLAHAAGYAYRGAAVGYSGGEVVDVTRLVVSGQTSLIVATSTGIVRADVPLVVKTQFLDRFFDQPEHITTHNIYPSIN